MTSQPHSDAEIRELLRNLRKPDKLDLAYPITATEDDLVALIKEQTRLARKDEVKLMKNFVHAETKRGGSAVYGFNKAVGYFRFKADERIDALQTNNKEEEV